MYAVSSGSSKRDLALSLGACEYIDSSKIDIVEYMSSLGGANLILCTAPYSKAINAIIPAVTKNGKPPFHLPFAMWCRWLTSSLGTITLVSAATDGPIQVDNLLLNMNRATLRGFACGCAPDMEKCIEYSATNNVKAMIKVFTMDEFTQAYNGVMDSTAKFRHVIVFP